MPALGAAVEVDGLVVRYGDRVAVDGLSISAVAGEVLALLGPNGAGKTSTVEVLEGYRPRAGGQVRVLGLDPAADHARLAPRVGVMLQRGGVYPTMPAGEVLRLFARFYADPDDPAALLDRVGLAERAATPWRRLSGGEQQRLSLALALVGRPEVVFLDEPTAGVDPAGRIDIRGVVAGLRDAGACVLLTTHELDEAARLADRIAIVDHGRLVAEGTPASLVASGGQRVRFSAPPGIDVAALGATLGGAVRDAGSGDYVAEVAPTPAALAALTGWLAERDLPLADLRTTDRLEDVFLRLTGEAGP
ncbi:MAG TPA: ABC transporter ATP-binding protein [Acidimicrobiales bacterium]|nr:ABC transporter ATP-binding protein [Acidimicrobiales bacterium]